MPLRLWIVGLLTIAGLGLGSPGNADETFPLVPPDVVFPTSIEMPPGEAKDGEDKQNSTEESLKEFQSTLDQFETKLDGLDEKLTITSRDKEWSLTVFGAMTGEMIYASQRPVLPSAIVLISPSTGRNTPTYEIHAKQSSLGLALKGPEIFGMESGAGVVTFFFGEVFLADQQGLFIPRAYGELKNEDWRFAFGALGDVINPRLPGTLDFNHAQAAGNLGYFRGQFRAEHYIHFDDEAQLTLQLGLGNPITTSFTRNIRNLVEDNGWPNVETRVMLGMGPTSKRGPLEMRPLEFGISGLVGQIRRSGIDGAVFNVWAIGADARLELTDYCGLKAEFFHGQAIGNYNAAIVQIFNPFTLQAIRTVGGWGEFYVHWTDNLRSHFAAGVDDPVNSTLSPGLPTRNQFAFANLIWDATKSLEIGFEVARWQTDYTPGAQLGNLPLMDNAAMIYRTRVMLKF